MSHFAVRYTYTDDAEAINEARPAHRAFLAALAEQGFVVASGPLTSDPAGALLIIRAESSGQVATTLAEDPFRTAGFIAHTEIVEWNPVIGVLANRAV